MANDTIYHIRMSEEELYYAYTKCECYNLPTDKLQPHIEATDEIRDISLDIADAYIRIRDDIEYMRKNRISPSLAAEKMKADIEHKKKDENREKPWWN